jgi:uncharacterized protein involved in exopolysaccharide biosynthesis
MSETISDVYVESLNKVLNSLAFTEVQRQVEFLESRLGLARTELKDAETSLLEFQKENKVLIPQAQAQAGIELRSKLQESLISERLKMNYLNRTEQENSVNRQEVEANLKSLEAQLRGWDSQNDPKVAGKSGKSSTVTPEILTHFGRLKREVEIKGTIYELVIREYELARAAAAKERMAVEIVDKAEALPFRVAPKFKLTIAIFAALGLILSLLLIFAKEGWNIIRRDAEVVSSLKKIQDELRFRS